MFAHSKVWQRIMATALWAAILIPTNATAQTPSPFCGDRGAIVSRLERTYAETRTGFGLTADGRLLELFASPSGSWTILITSPGGPTCMATSGDSWRVPANRTEGPLA